MAGTGKTFKKGEEAVARYDLRTSRREKTLMSATMNAVAYFMLLGDTQEDAEAKVQQISGAVRAADGGAKFDYVLGDTQPLIDAINGIDEVALPFFDAAAKTALVSDLTIT